MKKKLFMIACCLMATAQCVFAQSEYTGKVFLQHNGNITGIFGGDQIDKAIEAAVDGDTLFLSKGLFKNNFSINNLSASSVAERNLVKILKNQLI